MLAQDCAAGATEQTHQVQITQHLPLLATVTDSESIIASLKAQAAGDDLTTAGSGWEDA